MPPKAHLKAQSSVALRYMSGFQCLGATCEDHCCGGWQIGVDQGHYGKLRKLLGRGPHGAEDFARTFALVTPAERSREHFAVLRLKDDGACPLFCEGLCAIHRDHGEDSLPDTCASYPRHVAQVGDRLELSGSLACPEATRRALLSADATDLCPIPAEVLQRGFLRPTVTTEQDPGLARHLDEVRGTMYQLAGATDFPMASRLFFMACCATNADPLFTTHSIDQPLLEAELDAIGKPDTQAELHRRLAGAATQIAPAMSVVAAALSRCVHHSRRTAFRRVVEAVVRSYAAEPGSGLTSHGDGDELEVNIDPAALCRAYEARRQQVLADPALAVRVEIYLRNYCQVFWMKEWYMLSGGLARHVVSLLLRLSLLRFLLFSHPVLATSQPGPQPRSPAALDELAVTVTYTLSRAIEHSPDFLNSLIDAPTLPLMIGLILI